MQWRPWVAAVLASACMSTTAAEVLYAASVRSTLGDVAHPIAGNLYTVSIPTAVFSLVAPIRADGKPIGITGLADHPQTGVLFGITSEASPNHARVLVTVDPTTGEARVIGELGAAGSDIAFDARGRLFVWLRESSRLGTIDLETGRATPIGPAREAGPTGGLAIDAAGRVYVAATGAAGTLDVVDPATGRVTKGPALRGAPYGGGINSLSFGSGGRIFAVNTNLGAPANTLLVTIDPVSGLVTQLGPLPNDTDALVFMERTSWLRAAILPVAVLGAIAVGAAFAIRRRRKS